MKEYRLRRAMELLRQGEGSIAEIAEQVGYESQGNFSEAFKALTHVSPSEYRRRCRGAPSCEKPSKTNCPLPRRGGGLFV